MEVFEPGGHVQFAAGEVAGGDEAEDRVLQVGVEFGEGVAGAAAGDGFELVEAEAVVEGDGGQGGVGLEAADAGDQAGVDAGGDVLREGVREKQGDRLERGELGGIEILGDIKGSAVDEALQPDGGRRGRCSA